MSKKKSNETKDKAARPEQKNREREPDVEDLQDSARDEERLKSDEAILDLPEVKDIPGQEFIHVPRIGEMADTTISSDDEEGVGIFNDQDEVMEEADTGTPEAEFPESGETGRTKKDEENNRKKSEGRESRNGRE